MLKSMTGFGAAVAETDDYKVSVELKAVNQRFLELNFHMGCQLNPWEDMLRRTIRRVAARGKMDIYIKFTDKRESQARIHVNKGLVQAYHQALNDMSDMLHVARPDDVTIFAGFPDILQLDRDIDISPMEPVLLQAMEDALKQFDAMRQTEGETICQDFQRRLDRLAQFTEQVHDLAPTIVQGCRDRLQAVLRENLADTPIDEMRIIQETALYADKVNYTEEVIRLGSHFQQFRQIINAADEPVGRKLDFLIQELNRETNTIGSKANSTEVAQIVVDMKSEIEKLREQVQNIE